MKKTYTITTETIAKAGSPDTKGANAVVFVNRGEATAFVNGETIATDQSIENSGLPDEIDNTIYKITFVNTGAQSQLVFVRVKKYQ